jgi:hypothetical protein
LKVALNTINQTINLQLYLSTLIKPFFFQIQTGNYS